MCSYQVCTDPGDLLLLHSMYISEFSDTLNKILDSECNMDNI